jgi:hypothetical protein
MLDYAIDKTGEKYFFHINSYRWLAAMTSHVANKGEQIVRYDGHYSNVSRGLRQKKNLDDLIPSILQPENFSKEYRKNWPRLIQKICEVDPMTCPKRREPWVKPRSPFRHVFGVIK